MGVEPEVYILNNPEANAYAPAFGAEARPLVVLHSGIVSLLRPNELAFTLGHELGHLGLGHSSRPRRHGPSNEYDALRERSRQRYAEISADRVGLLAVRSVYTSANVMIKLASGLSSEYLALDVDGFVNQLGDEEGQRLHGWRLSQSHPSLPMRMWALIQFSNSDAYASLTRQAAQGGSLGDTDALIAKRFDALGDGQLADHATKAYEKALLWVATALVLDDDLIEEHEEIAMRQLIGETLANKALAFARDHGRAAVLSKLRTAAKVAIDTDQATQARLLRSAESFAISINLDAAKTEAVDLLNHLIDRD